MITKTCDTCGKAFQVANGRTKARFCSRACRYPPQPEVVCEVCGVTFHVRAYRKDTARFCSRSCQSSWIAKTYIAHIPKPWAVELIKKNGTAPNSGSFTSERVRGSNNPRWVEGQEFTCEHCGKVFKVKPWLVRQNGTPRFCSRTCFSESKCFVGERSTTWVGGPSTYRGRNWKQARQATIQRDGGACRICGAVIGKSIPVHHIRPFREFETAKAANQLSNLVCVCQPCHAHLETRRDELARMLSESAQL